MSIEEKGGTCIFFFIFHAEYQTREFLVKVSPALQTPTQLRAVRARCPAIKRATISDETPPFHNILESGQTDKLHSETMTSGGTQRGDSQRTDIIIIVYTILYHPS